MIPHSRGIGLREGSRSGLGFDALWVRKCVRVSVGYGFWVGLADGKRMGHKCVRVSVGFGLRVGLAHDK